MRFWLTLILGTVVISALVTVLLMYQGAQTVARPPLPTSTSTKPPILTFVDLPADGTVRPEANYVIIRAPDSKLKQPNKLYLKFRNAGEGMLQLELVNASCGCTNITIDGQPARRGGDPINIAPGKAGEMEIRWLAEEKHMENLGPAGFAVLRIRIELAHNDLRFSDNFIIELTTKIYP